MCLVLLAVAQHFHRAAAEPPGTVPNQPLGSADEVAALHAALQQQLTPTCCSKLLQRLAPALLTCARRPLPQPRRQCVTLTRDDQCQEWINWLLQTITRLGLRSSHADTSTNTLGKLYGCSHKCVDTEWYSTIQRHSMSRLKLS
jgi:hypothetical protein